MNCLTISATAWDGKTITEGQLFTFFLCQLSNHFIKLSVDGKLYRENGFKPFTRILIKKKIKKKSTELASAKSYRLHFLVLITCLTPHTICMHNIPICIVHVIKRNQARKCAIHLKMEIINICAYRLLNEIYLQTSTDKDARVRTISATVPTCQNWWVQR